MKWTILILVVLGLVAAFSTLLLVNALRSDTKLKGNLKGEIEVIVVNRSLPAMSVITADFVGKKAISKSSLPDGYLMNPIQAIGKVLAIPVVEGQVLTKQGFISEGSGRQLASTLLPGMRAVTVYVSGNSVMGGFLYPGCIVDVLASFRLGYANKKGEAISTSLLQGIPVLAVGPESIVSKPDESEKGKSGKKSVQSGDRMTVTLMVDTKQAEALQLAMDNGKISLAMRNPLDKMAIDSDATVLSQGRLAKLGDFMTPSVAAGSRGAGKDPNSMNLQSKNIENLKRVFSDTGDEGGTSPQWPVTVIRGNDVKDEVVDIQQSEETADQNSGQ